MQWNIYRALPLLLLTLAAGCTQEMSSSQLASRVGEPHDTHFFGDRVLYMGDQDGYRYVHVRDLFSPWTYLGECEYKIPVRDWPMSQPMPYTPDPTHWQDVTWMNGNAPRGVPQDPFLYLTPTFPEGAPATQPTTVPATKAPGNFPALPPG